MSTEIGSNAHFIEQERHFRSPFRAMMGISGVEEQRLKNTAVLKRVRRWKNKNSLDN